MRSFILCSTVTTPVERTTLRIEIHSTPLSSTKIHHSITSPITSHHPLPYIHTHVQKTPRSHMPEIPCGRALRCRLPYTQHLSQVPRGRRAVGCGPGPPVPYPGKRGKAQHPWDPDPINHPPGAVYVHRYSALSALGKGGVIGSLADGFFLVCFSASVLLFGCSLK